LLLTDPSPKDAAPQLSFVAALALHDAVATCAPRVGPLLTLKWPNDLLLGGRKLAGILIEGESDPAFAVAIGIGVNCAHHPNETRYPATDLKTAGAVVPPGHLAAALAAAMQRRLGQWQRGEGFAAIRTDWLKRAAGLGQKIEIRLPERDLIGLFEGLDEAGRLILTGPAGRMTVTAGEVFGLGQG
jgi:BirA family biotin operon repressor/biotin-[acetyl-CoA-carboxylase] ligase